MLFRSCFTARTSFAITAAALTTWAFSATAAHAQVIQAADRGWYNTVGTHTPTNTNCIVGGTRNDPGEHRNFFVFDIPAGTYTSATLRLQLTSGFATSGALAGNYTSKDDTETFELHEVTSSIAALVAGGPGGGSIFTDLGDGKLYGSRVFSSADNSTTVNVVLNSAALAKINAVSGGQFALGGSLSTFLSTGPADEFVFGLSDGTTTAGSSLVLTPVAVPESGTIALAIPALGMLGALLTRRRKS